ncbi:MAG: putative zinc-binding metallopeptidase, partial [Candidatus Binatia bacterium]
MEELYGALARRHVRFRPHVWLSHDWFSPEGIPGIAIPFYLAHPRLMRLERSQMREVEGGSREECVKIVRHECGHALQHAYQLQRRRRWQQLFGKSSQQYPHSYQPNPASRHYVQHLRLYYAQSHPDEDFAETFAVWCQPRAIWRKRYLGWPALKKLAYVDALMEELKQTPLLVHTRKQLDPLSTIQKTLRA